MKNAVPEKPAAAKTETQAEPPPATQAPGPTPAKNPADPVEMARARLTGAALPPRDKPMATHQELDNGEDGDAARDPGELLAAIIFDIALILDQLHPSYMRNDISEHRARLRKRVEKFREITNGGQ